MNRRGLLALAVAYLGAASPARAEMPPNFVERQPESYRSPQHFAIELKLGPYSPNIDSSPGLGGRTPFADVYNPARRPARPPGRLMVQLEFDWQFWHGFGSLGAGATGGYMRRTSHGFVYPVDGSGTVITDPATGNPIPCQLPDCTRSGDQTALNLVPLALQLVYRFDVLAMRYSIPLVPYMKAGLAYYVWWIENGGGFLSVAQVPSPSGSSVSGYGGTFGLVLNPGISLLLDILDPPAARALDNDLGINHTYLFFELNYAKIDGFGAANKLVLSDLTWNAGLAFEF